MKTMKSILRFSLILYLCLFLTGAAYIFTASAKITPNPDVEGTALITIVKGDTLWDLAAKHLENSRAWPEFKKYNNFTNPDQIYPDEMMRIPVEMVEEIVEDADKIELEAVKNELAAMEKELTAMEAEATSAKEAVGVTAADVTAIKKMVEDLIARQETAEDGLQHLKKDLSERHAASVDKINTALMEHAEASKMAISKVRKGVKAVHEHLDKLGEMEKEHQKESMMKLEEKAKMLAAGIEGNAKSLDKLHEIERGATEEPNKSKRTLAFLTTLAGGTAWFVISALGSD